MFMAYFTEQLLLLFNIKTLLLNFPKVLNFWKVLKILKTFNYNNMLKKTLLLIFIKLFFTISIFSQIIATDFTLVDINGVSHNLYDELDEGKTVVIDFFSLSCGSCQTGIASLEEFWQNNKTNNDLSVWAIEIYGSGDEDVNEFLNNYGGTFTAFSLPNGNQELLESYGVTYTPIYVSICPNKYVKKGNVEDMENLYNNYCNHISFTENINSNFEKTKNISYKNNKLSFDLYLEKNKELEMTIFNSFGQKIISEKRNFIKGKVFFQFKADFFKKKIYILQVSENKKVLETRKIIFF